CVSFSSKKERRDFSGYKHRYKPVCTPRALLRTRKALRVLILSPRICRACRPTPCPHFACKPEGLAIKGEAGGPPHIVAQARRAEMPGRTGSAGRADAVA